jgi:hypothetical protein
LKTKISTEPMTNKNKLILVKLLHTVVWLFFNVVIFYLLYAVIVNKIDIWVWICLGLILLEGAVLLVFKKMCPITLIARKYSDSPNHNFDIYLPEWLAKYNKLIYTTIVIIAVIILIFQLYGEI